MLQKIYTEWKMANNTEKLHGFRKQKMVKPLVGNIGKKNDRISCQRCDSCISKKLYNIKIYNIFF